MKKLVVMLCLVFFSCASVANQYPGVPGVDMKDSRDCMTALILSHRVDQLIEFYMDLEEQEVHAAVKRYLRKEAKYLMHVRAALEEAIMRECKPT
jgi:hypothetical protein